LKRKETVLIDALAAETHEYMGIVQLEPGSDTSDWVPSWRRGAPYRSPHCVAKFVMFASSMPSGPQKTARLLEETER